MELKSIKRNKKNIKFVAIYNSGTENVEADEERSVLCVEMPNEEFGKSMQNLTMVVVEVMQVPKEYVNGMIILGFTIKRTKNGTRSLEIQFSKGLDKTGKAEAQHKMKTPYFRIDEPQDGDDGELAISPKSVKQCKEAILEATNYAKGDRAQMTFDQHLEQMGALADKAETEEQQEDLLS